LSVARKCNLCITPCLASSTPPTPPTLLQLTRPTTDSCTCFACMACLHSGQFFFHSTPNVPRFRAFEKGEPSRPDKDDVYWGLTPAERLECLLLNAGVAIHKRNDSGRVAANVFGEVGGQSAHGMQAIGGLELHPGAHHCIFLPLSLSHRSCTLILMFFQVPGLLWSLAHVAEDSVLGAWGLCTNTLTANMMCRNGQHFSWHVGTHCCA
jgi:hypothetical protein